MTSHQHPHKPHCIVPDLVKMNLYPFTTSNLRPRANKTRTGIAITLAITHSFAYHLPA
jgi:hypothetical protein